MSVVVLISGSGSNLQALLDAGIPVKHVISSSAKAYGLERAQKAGVATSVHSLITYTKGINKDDKEGRAQARERFNADLATKVIDLAPKLVVCAGWMLILSAQFLRPLNTKQIPIINLHPALPGAFPGIRAIERAYEAGRAGELKKGGVMVHYVIEAVDMGEPIEVAELDLREESLEEYTTRVHQAEHRIIVSATRRALEGGRR